MPKDFVDIVGDRVAQHNNRWISALFREHGGCTTRWRCVDDDASGHTYVFSDVVLNTWLERPAPAGATPGPRCGDNGGRTAKGTPCKNRAVLNGRCKRHPPEALLYNPNDRFAQVVVDWGNDHHHRPFGAPIGWAACTITVDGVPGHRVLAAMDDAATAHVPASAVWGWVFAEVAESLNALPDAHVDGARVDPAWSTDMLRERHGIVVGEPGHLLSDYGVTAATA